MLTSLLCAVIHVLITCTSSTNEYNASFHDIPQDARHIIYSYFTAEQHHSIRGLDKESHSLFVKLHTIKSDEMNSWIKLKTYLSQLRMTRDSNPVLWPLFTNRLQNYTAFMQPFRGKFTAHQIIMIEKLFCSLIHNSKIETSNIQRAVALALCMKLEGPDARHDTFLWNNGSIVLMMDIFRNRAIKCDMHLHNQSDTHHSEHHTCLRRMWELAASEKRITGNIENRYTLFALEYMSWIIHTRYGMSQHYGYAIPHVTDTSQQTADVLWDMVADVDFFRYFLSFESLLTHPIKNNKRLIALIIDNVFGANGTFESKYLNLFRMGRSVLWDLEDVIHYASSYCWSSMRRLLDWIFEYKLSLGAYNAVDVMHLLIDNNVFAIEDILCESCEIQMGETLTVSFDLLKCIIDGKETTQHKDRLQRWIALDGKHVKGRYVYRHYNRLYGVSIRHIEQHGNDTSMRSNTIHSEATELRPPKVMFFTHSNNNKTSNRHSNSCCSLL